MTLARVGDSSRVMGFMERPRFNHHHHHHLIVLRGKGVRVDVGCDT